MAQIQTIATGSKGNAYILQDDMGNQLLLDCGVKRTEIVKALNFSIDRLCGCVVTHGHHDHDLASHEMSMLGVSVWKPYLEENKRQIKKFGDFSVQSFPVPHDECDCVGYYIKFGTHKLLYATDCEYIPYSFANVGLTDLLIESNYESRFLDTEQAQFLHKVKGHFSLENCIEFIEHNQTPALANIIICHMSSYTLNVDEAITRIKQSAMPFTDVYAAKKGKVIRI